MVYGLVLVLHLLVCVVLIAVILLQGGRGGLSEALGGAAAQSLFGGGAATVFTRVTGICATIFVVTCLSLAYLSTIRGRSVLEQYRSLSPETLVPPAVPAGPNAAPPDDSATPPSSPTGTAPAAPPSGTSE